MKTRLYRKWLRIVDRRKRTYYSWIWRFCPKRRDSVRRDMYIWIADRIIDVLAYLTPPTGEEKKWCIALARDCWFTERIGVETGKRFPTLADAFRRKYRKYSKKYWAPDAVLARRIRGEDD